MCIWNRFRLDFFLYTLVLTCYLFELEWFLYVFIYEYSDLIFSSVCSTLCIWDLLFLKRSWNQLDTAISELFIVIDESLVYCPICEHNLIFIWLCNKIRDSNRFGRYVSTSLSIYIHSNYVLRHTYLRDELNIVILTQGEDMYW